MICLVVINNDYFPMTSGDLSTVCFFYFSTSFSRNCCLNCFSLKQKFPNLISFPRILRFVCLITIFFLESFPLSLFFCLVDVTLHFFSRSISCFLYNLVRYKTSIAIIPISPSSHRKLIGLIISSDKMRQRLSSWPLGREVQEQE